MKFINILTLIVLCLSSINTAVAVKIYKWVDENGQVHYGEQPLNDESADEVEIDHSPSPSQTPTTGNRLQKQQQLIRAYGEERRIKNKEKAEAKQKKQQRARDCKIAKENYQDYLTTNILYEHDKSGNRVYLDETQRQEALYKYKKSIEQHCQ